MNEAQALQIIQIIFLISGVITWVIAVSYSVIRDDGARLHAQQAFIAAMTAGVLSLAVGALR